MYKWLDTEDQQRLTNQADEIVVDMAAVGGDTGHDQDLDLQEEEEVAIQDPAPGRLKDAIADQDLQDGVVHAPTAQDVPEVP